MSERVLAITVLAILAVAWAAAVTLLCLAITVLAILAVAWAAAVTLLCRHVRRAADRDARAWLAAIWERHDLGWSQIIVDLESNQIIVTEPAPDADPCLDDNDPNWAKQTLLEIQGL